MIRWILPLPPHPVSSLRPLRWPRRWPALLATVVLVTVVLASMLAGTAQARTLKMRIDRVDSAVATLRDVSVQLAWPAGASQGELRLQARQARAPGLGYRFADLDWRCPLLRAGDNGWTCSGPVLSAGQSMQLSVAIGVDATEASLAKGSSRIGLRRDGATPDITRIDLARVPLAWTQALLSQAWPAARLVAGSGDARLTVTAADDAPLRIAGPVELHAAGLDTDDGAIAAEGLDARLDVDARLGDQDHITVDGELGGGDLLFGATFVSLEQRTVGLRVAARHREGGGWQLPELRWNDPGVLDVAGSAALDADAGLGELDLRLRAPALGLLGDGYLGGWLGLAGLGGLQLQGAADGLVQMRDGTLAEAVLRLHQVAVDDAAGRFAFQAIDGDVAFSTSAAMHSELRWAGGALYGIGFGAARLPFDSGDGALRLAEPVEVALLGGRARFEHLQIQPPAPSAGMDLRFGLSLEQLDVAQLSAALDWPAFTGELSGTIPEARYADERLVFEGGLDMRLFGGSVGVSALSMERPFGVLPTLSADIVFDDIDLMALTGAFDFGSISGKLDGRIGELRLVGWQPVAFDAQLATDRHRGVRQRISQRAVQDLTSVGNASFVNSLQSQLIGLFDDFGYSRIAIGCRLADEVCTMGGLAAAGEGFVIVRGSGLPRLTVVGYNRRVDWPTLVERLAAVTSGEVKAVVD